mgnify:CR=1 FL=1
MKSSAYILVLILFLSIHIKAQDTYNVTRVNGNVTFVKTGNELSKLPSEFNLLKEFGVDNKIFPLLRTLILLLKRDTAGLDPKLKVASILPL